MKLLLLEFFLWLLVFDVWRRVFREIREKVSSAKTQKVFEAEHFFIGSRRTLRGGKHP